MQVLLALSLIAPSSPPLASCPSLLVLPTNFPLHMHGAHLARASCRFVSDDTNKVAGRGSKSLTARVFAI